MQTTSIRHLFYPNCNMSKIENADSSTYIIWLLEIGCLSSEKGKMKSGKLLWHFFFFFCPIFFIQKEWMKWICNCIYSNRALFSK